MTFVFLVWFVANPTRTMHPVHLECGHEPGRLHVRQCSVDICSHFCFKCMRWCRYTDLRNFFGKKRLKILTRKLHQNCESKNNHCMQGYVTLTWNGSLKPTFAEPAPPLASTSPWLSHALARQSRSSRSYALHFSWMLLAPLWVSPLVGPTPACRAVVWQ